MITEEKWLVLDSFAEGRRFYKLMQFKKAREAFARALEADSTDGPSRVYRDRCDFYIKNPPAEDWDGVFTMTTK